MNIGDRVRIAAAKSAPVLTVAELYIQGDPERLWASCTWRAKAQQVDFPVDELVAEGRG